MEELTWMKLCKNTKAIDLYNFIKEELPFDIVIELYKLLQFKMTMLEDKEYDCVICESDKIKEGNYE